MDTISSILQAFSLRRYYVHVLVVIAIFFVAFLLYVNDPPTNFPRGTFITIQSGDTLYSVAKVLKTKGLVRSTILLRGLPIVLSGDHKLVAGDYYFGRPITTFSLISRLTSGDFDIAPIRVTIPEGYSMSQIAESLSKRLPHFSVTDFMKYSPVKEGYLFPDTYLFQSNVTTDEVINILQGNFEEKIKSIQDKIKAFGKSEKDVVTMASILEEEARTTEDWRIISGILWKRIKIGMPLQVDASLGYITGRASLELTTADLKATSPYNTYTHKGLPPTPIANPGLKTIEAAVTPVSTPYLYYLSDKNGVIHYAATFEEHIKNRQKYLK